MHATTPFCTTGVVDEWQCYHMEQPRHEALMQQCRPAACRPPPQSHARFSLSNARTHWWVGSWQPCEKSCHMPVTSTLVHTAHRTFYAKERDKIWDTFCLFLSPVDTVLIPFELIESTIRINLSVPLEVININNCRT